MQRNKKKEDPSAIRMRQFIHFCNDMQNKGYRSYLSTDWVLPDGIHYRSNLSAGIEVVSYENIVFVRDIYKKK